MTIRITTVSLPEELCQNILIGRETMHDVFAVFDIVKNEIKREEASIAFAGPTDQVRDNQNVYVCRACSRVTTKVYDSPESTSFKPTCENLFCGGTCDPIFIVDRRV